MKAWLFAALLLSTTVVQAQAVPVIQIDTNECAAVVESLADVFVDLTKGQTMEQSLQKADGLNLSLEGRTIVRDYIQVVYRDLAVDVAIAIGTMLTAEEERAGWVLQNVFGCFQVEGAWPLTYEKYTAVKA